MGITGINRHFLNIPNKAPSLIPTLHSCNLEIQVGSSDSQNSARNPSCDGVFFGKLSTFPIGICILEWGQGTFGLGSKAWKSPSLFPIILRDEFRDEFTSPGQGIIGFIQFLFLLSGIILSLG